MTGPRQRVTSLDVARAAGVSQSAVSRAFTAGASVAPDTRARVLAAASALGYRPNILARSLVSRTSGLVGIVMGHLTNPFYPAVLEAFGATLRQVDKRMLLIPVPDGDVDQVIGEVLQHQVDGIVIASATLSSALAEECARQGRPVVLFNRTTTAPTVATVSCDNEGAGRLVARALVAAGHTRLLYVAGTPDSSTNLERERGFHAEAAALGAGVRVVAGLYHYETAFAAVTAALQDPPEAVFAANDVMGCAAIDAARRRGLAVPRDLSVIAMDDGPMAAWAGYDLTVIRQPVAAMVAAAVDLLLAAGSGAPPAHVRLPGTLTRRGSARL